MAVLKVVLNPAGHPDPLNPNMEVAAFSGNSHKIYLDNITWGNNIIVNGGGEGTTDWNPQSGLATYWYSKFGGTISVVTGNGFTGYAQRMYTASAQSSSYGIYTQDSFNAGWYKIKFKYRSNRAVEAYNQYGGGPPTDYIGSLIANTGNAIWSSEFVVYLSQGWSLGLGAYSPVWSAGDWIEVDEVNAYLRN